MTSGILYDQGDIVLVPFPFTNLRTIKKRPVLILSQKEYHTKTKDIITCGITSNLGDDHCSVLIDTTYLLQGQLPVSSRIKVDKLFTLEQSLVIKKLGKINKDTMQKVKEILFELV